MRKDHPSGFGENALLGARNKRRQQTCESCRLRQISRRREGQKLLRGRTQVGYKGFVHFVSSDAGVRNLLTDSYRIGGDFRVGGGSGEAKRQRHVWEEIKNPPSFRNVEKKAQRYPM